MAKALRRVAAILGVLGVVLGIVSVRVVISSRAELAAGDAARADDDIEAARLHYRRAAKWYAPGNAYCTDALDRLRELAEAAERTEDTDAALASWRSIRASILATRSSYVPHARRLAHANRRIALLLADDPPPIDAGLSLAERREAYAQSLEEVPRPVGLWTLLMLAGFLVWVVAVFAFAIRAVDAEDRFVRPHAIRWGAMILIGFAAFVVGLSQA